MKPHGVVGVEIESVGEAMALGALLGDAQNIVPEDNAYYPVLEPTATYVTGRAEAHVLAHGEDSDEPFSIVFPEQMAADMVRLLVRLGAESHPDPVVQQTAADMNASYAEAVFNASMGQAPPDDEPPRQYRSPFAD